MTRNDLADLICKTASDKKAKDIMVIDISASSIIADDFIICSAPTSQQVRAISDHIEDELGKAGVSARKTDGYQEGRWIVLDYGDAMVHIFRDEDRLFYNLERLWTNGGNARKYFDE